LKHSRYGSNNRHHRQSRKSNGLVGAIIRGVACLVTVGVCVLAIRWAADRGTGSYVPENSPTPAVGSSLSVLAGHNASAISSGNRRPVYPYSVVPGGVASAEELKEAAAHDHTVADHYKNFNYRHGRIVTVEKPELVYLSYRRGDHVYWTRKQVSLHKGEKLVTDGHTTARTRCGNQVSVLPQAETAPEEPTEDELDRPDAVASGIRAFPGTLNSSLFDVDPVLPLSPGPGGSTSGSPSGNPPGTFIPPPIGGPVGGTNGCPPENPGSNPNCPSNPPPPPPPPPPPAVPEPGTLVLFASGAAAAYARFRTKRD